MEHEIVLVEDEMVVGLELRKTLERLGYRVSDVLTSGEGAVDYVLNNDVDLVLMDVKLQGALDGIEATNRLHESRDVPVVFITSYSDEKMLERIRQTEACGYIKKPFDKDDLASVTRHAFDEADETPSVNNGEILFECIEHFLSVLVLGLLQDVKRFLLWKNSPHSLSL